MPSMCSSTTSRWAPDSCKIEHGHDVAVHQRGGDARFVEERLLQRLVELVAHELQDDAAREPARAFDLGEQHASHAPFAEGTHDAIATDVLAGRAHLLHTFGVVTPQRSGGWQVPQSSTSLQPSEMGPQSLP